MQVGPLTALEERVWRAWRLGYWDYVNGQHGGRSMAELLVLTESDRLLEPFACNRVEAELDELREKLLALSSAEPDFA